MFCGGNINGLHRSAEVRKGCVFVYVELYKVKPFYFNLFSTLNWFQVLGDGLQPHLKGLSASQVMIEAAACTWCGQRTHGFAGQARERLHRKGSA